MEQHTRFGYLDGDDVWCQVTGPCASVEPRPALFLDRDGVIVDEVLYLHRVEDLALLPGAAETIRAANHLGVPVVMVTNQAGIARGYYGWKEFDDVQNALFSSLGRLDARIDGVFACPHYPVHPARKPQPGMLIRAAEAMHIDLGRSWIVGDKASDLQAGRAAGLSGGVLVMTGHGPAHQEPAMALRTSSFEVRIGRSISGAPALIPLFQ